MARLNSEDTDQRVNHWSEVLEHEVQSLRGEKRRRVTRLAVLGGGFLVLAFVTGWHNLYILYIGCMGFVGGAAAIRSRRWQRAASALASTNNPRAVNALAIACRADPQPDRMASLGLKRLLPTLREADRSSLTPDGMGALIALLRDQEPSLVRAVVKALAHVGDDRAIAAVRALSVQNARSGSHTILSPYRWKTRSVSSDWQDVQAAAAETLLALETREERNRQHSALLRAAESAPPSLLRPASVTESPQEQLLRPA